MTTITRLGEIFAQKMGIEPGKDPKNAIVYGSLANILGSIAGYQMAGPLGLVAGGLVATYLAGKNADAIAEYTGLDFKGNPEPSPSLA